MNATLDLTFVYQYEDGSLTYHAAYIAPECLPSYFEMVIFKGQIGLVEPLDSYTPTGSLQALVECVKLFEDGSGFYRTELGRPCSLKRAYPPGS